MLVSQLNHVYSSLVTRLPPPPSQIEPECLLPAPTMFIQVWSLISHFFHVHLSLNTHFSSQPCLFKLGHLSPISAISAWVWTQALALVPWLHCVHSSTTTCFSSLHPFSSNMISKYLSTHLDVSIQAWPLSPTWIVSSQAFAWCCGYTGHESWFDESTFWYTI